jgi:hypothetical protein
LSESQIVASQFEIGFVAQRLFASRSGLLVATELVVGGADIVPRFGVIRPVSRRRAGNRLQAESKQGDDMIGCQRFWNSNQQLARVSLSEN